MRIRSRDVLDTSKPRATSSVPTRSRKEFRRVLARGAMLF
jgi:hypothetical protein